MNLRWAGRISLTPLLCGTFLTLAAHLATAANNEPPAGAVWVLKIDGAIGPATSDYVVRGFSKAQDAGASLIVIEMNTPGGLDNAMRDIIRAILASPVPVASYVSPRGSRAASAGTYIMYASHFAAMAEATNLGAATPVQIGPSAPEAPAPNEDDKQEDKKGNSDGSQSHMERKMINDAAAYIRSLADLRGRNAEWAEKAVREAASLSAKEALEMNVIDFIATDLDDLIRQLDGRTVKVEGGPVVLALAGKPVHVRAPDWRTELLSTLTNPNLVLVLGMIGIYGIILEFYNPGSMIPGTVGIICLLLAGYSLQLLPVNYAGLALMIVGIGLMIGEATVPSFGVMGIGGIIAFSIGGILLFDSEVEAFQVGIPAIAAIGTVTALLIFATINIALKMRRKAVTTGVETLIGRSGEALTDIENKGQVKIGGEIWEAGASQPISRGDKVRVVSVDNLKVSVEKLERQ